MCERYVHDSLVITRNVESQTLLSSLRIPTELGTDTAWTFEPQPPEYARKVLRESGWDEKTPYSSYVDPSICLARESIRREISRSVDDRAYKESQYRTVISSNPDRK